MHYQININDSEAVKSKKASCAAINDFMRHKKSLDFLNAVYSEGRVEYNNLPGS